jgi:hypothetical protein
MIDILLGGLIFGYAGWTIYRYAKKSKEGKCANCAVSSTCKMNACTRTDQSPLTPPQF